MSAKTSELARLSYNRANANVSDEGIRWRGLLIAGSWLSQRLNGNGKLYAFDYVQPWLAFFVCGALWFKWLFMRGLHCLQ